MIPLRRTITLVTCSLALAASAGVTYFFNENAKEISRRAFLKGMQSETQLLSLYYGEQYRQFAADAELVSKAGEVRSLLSENNDPASPAAALAAARDSKQRVTTLFKALLESRPEYKQARLIGVRNGGKEIVRVDRDANGVTATPDVALQNKSNESYYKQIVNHDWHETHAHGPSGGERHVLFSPVTFNREEGRISYPLTYTLRVMHPVLSATNGLEGFIIVNIDYGTLLSSSFGGIDKDSNVIVMNDQGDYMTYFTGGEIARLEVAGQYTRPPTGIAEKLLTADQESGVLEADGNISYFTTMPINPEQPARKIKIAFVQPVATTVAKIGGIGMESALAAALVVALAVVAAFILITIIMRPLNILRAEVKRATKGETALNLPVQWKNELGQLAKAFQLLVDKHVQAESRLRLILDNVGEGILSIDTSGKIVTFNPACEEIFGYEAEEVIGQNVSMLMPLRHARHHDNYLTRYQKEGTRRIDWSGRTETGKRSDGTTFPLELTVTETMLGKRRLFVGILRDISERQLAEKANADFLATVSHALRMPLTAIRDSLAQQRSGAQASAPETDTKISRLTVDTGESLQELIDTLLDLERIKAKSLKLNKERFDLLDLVKEVVADWRGDPEKPGLAFVTAPDSTPAIVNADRKQVRRVLINLLANAERLSETGGTVDVTVLRDTQNRIARLSIVAQGQPYPREVAIDETSETPPSATEQAEGSELGLIVARELVALHDGAMHLEPTQGRGVNYAVELPLGDRGLNGLLRDRREPSAADLT
ncbi:sensor histidine kinase [Thioclava atlantica]|uniref:Sensor protein FixL n=1 Tax=Thioclava atlantica TaxID=1317124 RepID=A0A085TU01_9RHOB|nr:sensor histidine kinase [Thioclava atlantica]KFE34198.1 signal transduction histidine kinase [Thioclava atlantica]